MPNKKDFNMHPIKQLLISMLLHFQFTASESDPMRHNDPEAMYNPLTIAELQTLAPSVSINRLVQSPLWQKKTQS